VRLVPPAFADLLLLEHVPFDFGCRRIFSEGRIPCQQAPNRAIRVWTYAMPDGKLEQYPVAPIG